MEHVNMRVAMILCKYADRVTAHLDDGWHTPQYNLNV
jgi:hypothetical protein